MARVDMEFRVRCRVNHEKRNSISLPTEEVFQVNGQNWPVANLPVVDFNSQRSEMLTPKPLNTQLSVFLLLH